MADRHVRMEFSGGDKNATDTHLMLAGMLASPPSRYPMAGMMVWLLLCYHLHP